MTCGSDASVFHPRPEITRRDFLNGSLIAAGGATLGGGAPLSAFGAKARSSDSCGDFSGGDARFARGGNVPEIFEVAHWLRDDRLRFSREEVVLAPGCDGREGRFAIANDAEECDVIVAGGGLAGLSAAFYLLRRRPNLRVHMLEAAPVTGGNAASDAAPPLPVRASCCGAYGAMPDSEHLKELFKVTGIDLDAHRIAAPDDSYYFDEHAPGGAHEGRGWRIDMPKRLVDLDPKQAREFPFDAKLFADLKRCAQTLRDWGDKDGGPTEPPEASDPKFDHLSEMSFASYLTDVLRCDPRVVEFYRIYTTDCMGGLPRSVNAHTVISFLSSEYSSASFAYPGGTHRIAEGLADWLTGKDAAGRARPFSLQTQAMVLRVETEASKVSVIYWKDGKFRRRSGRTLILATQPQIARHLVDPLLDEERRAAWAQFNTAPAIVANVAVKTMAPIVKLGLGYRNYYWGSKYWSNMIVADWTTPNRHDPERASVLTFYSEVKAPPEEFSALRASLLSTPFAAYEASLREDLGRILQGAGFDFEKHVTAVFLYRWGHSMILPGPGSLFGATRDGKGRLRREKAPRRIACRELGGISFAGQYTEGSPSLESAIGSGHRAMLETLARL